MAELQIVDYHQGNGTMAICSLFPGTTSMRAAWTSRRKEAASGCRRCIRGTCCATTFSTRWGSTPHALALALRVPPNRITAILAGQRAVTAETALRLACHFGTSPGFWLNLQKSYELEVAEREAGARIRAEVAPRELPGAARA